jgi:hypothetical protein
MKKKNNSFKKKKRLWRWRRLTGHTTWRNETSAIANAFAKKWQDFNYATAYYYKTQI